MSSSLKITKKSARDYILYSAIIVVGIILDQLTKWLSVKFLSVVETVPIIKNVIHLTYVENKGAAFGMLADHRWVFMTISSVAIIAIALYLYSGRNTNKLYTSALMLIVSGGIGNMIDRIALGYVVDFIDFALIDFAVFNIADSLVCIGAGLLILSLVLDIINEAKLEKAKKK